jgi:hypothetical protein
MIMTDDDLEFDEAGRAALRRLEAMMQWRGYVRHPEYGFWMLPDTEVVAPVPQDNVENDD